MLETRSIGSILDVVSDEVDSLIDIHHNRVPKSSISSPIRQSSLLMNKTNEKSSSTNK